MIELVRLPKADYNVCVVVFASSIQERQLKEIIPVHECSPDRYRAEREYFLWWLREPDKGGRFRFTDQLSAWEAYKAIHEPIELEEDEEFTPSWMDEINQKINESLSLRNYNDYGGQL